jgi:hypothetical protein
MSLPAWQIPGAQYPLPDNHPTWAPPAPSDGDRQGLINDFVIFVKFGGLGDHLFFSHIPRVAKEAGYEKVYVSTASAFRHEDYKEVWTLNPHCDGFTNAPPRYLPALGEVPAGQNLLDRKMLDMGLDDGKRLHEPEFYYKPKMIDKFRDATIFDPNFITGAGQVSTAQVEQWMKSAGVQVDFQFKWRQVHVGVSQGEVVETATLHDYADVIFSCKHFIAMTSGGATLAPAMGKGCSVLYGEGHVAMFRHSPLCTYVRI